MNSFKESSIFFDLSHELSPETSTFPVAWHKKVEFEKLGTLEAVGRRTTHIHIGTHSGTHIDAPSHFISDGLTIDKLNLDIFLGDAFVYNLQRTEPCQEVSTNELSTLELSDVEDKILIFNFGWASNFGNHDYYSKQPYLSNSACEYILSLKPRMIGYDLAMPDNPLNNQASNCDSPAHKLFLNQGIPLLENLNLPIDLPNEIYMSCTPLKLKDLDGSPVRCVGWING